MSANATHTPAPTPDDVVWTAHPEPDPVFVWCRCGVLNCPDVDAHDFAWRGSELTWREAAVRPFPGAARARNFSARRAAA